MFTNWFKRTSKNGVTITRSSRGVAVSTSSGNKGYRVTNTTKSWKPGKIFRLTTQRSGGFTNRRRKTF
jgi:hypothetical protein